MNKGNLNKLVTNYPVQLTNEEVENLSLTLSAVRTAGGGGGESKTYRGEGFVSVNNTNNSISLTTEANEKLNQSIPTKVSDLSDSANYQTVAGMDEYLSTANAQTLYQTKEAMSAYATREWTTNGFVTEQVLYDTLQGYVDEAALNTRLLNKQDKLTFAYDNDKISAINGSALAGQGGVTGDYYSASNPSGFINSTQAETQILEKHYLTKASGDLYYLPNPSELIEGTQYAYTTQGWSPIQGGGGASGISFVNHDGTLTGDGNTVKLGVDTTVIQTKLSDAEIQNITDVTTLKTASSTWDNVSAKLNTTDFNTYTGTTAPSIYQEKGNYLSSNALDGYATTALLDTISGKIESDIPTTVTQLTDSGNYYKKSETSGASELSTEFAKYLTNTQYNTDSSTFVTKPTSLVNQYLVLRTDNAGNVSGWCDFQDQSYSKTEAQRTFVATANIDTTTLSGDGKSVSTKLGVKTDVIATIDYVSGNYLPTSGGTVSGQLEVHGGSNFDSQFIKLTREGNSCGARIGLGSDTTNGTLALKTFNGQGQNTVQVNIKHNTNNNELIQVQKGGSDVGFLIPAVTATTTDGLTNDGILHIILES